MAEAAVRRHLSVREFFAWEGEPDVRYELWHGTPVAMTPPLAGHQAIMMALGGHLLLRREDVLRLESVGLAVDLGAIYARVPLPREAREDAAASSSDAGAV